MKKSFVSLTKILVFCLFTIPSLAQTTITGSVRNATNKDVVPAVSVTVKGAVTGTFTNEKGEFKLVLSQKPPLTLVFTSVGYETKEMEIKEATTDLHIDFTPASSLGTEVVVSASRVPQIRQRPKSVTL